MISIRERFFIDSIISRICDDYKTLFNVNRLQSINCNSINRYPSSLVAKVNISFDKTEERNIYIKISMMEQTHKLIKKEFQILDYYHKKFNGNPIYGVVKPIAYYDDPPTLITEEATGVAFNIIIKNKVKLITSSSDIKSLSLCCRACGEWLRQFQKITPPIEEKQFSTEDIKKFLNLGSRIDKCLDEDLIDKKSAYVLRKYIESKEQCITDLNIRIAGMHSDFVLSNMAVSEQRVTVFDFGAFTHGATCRDVATFLYSLDKFRTNPTYNFSILDRLKKEFLLGYKWNIEEENPSLFNLFQIREILGGLLHATEPYNNDFMRYIRFRRFKKISTQLLLSIVHNT